MQPTTFPHVPTSDHNSLMLASFVMQDVHRTLAGVHGIVAVLLHYALIGATVTNNLIELTAE
ncbi:MAG: hypothetical protein QM730_05240 [Anaerolineales bacterium]